MSTEGFSICKNKQQQQKKQLVNRINTGSTRQYNLVVNRNFIYKSNRHGQKEIFVDTENAPKFQLLNFKAAKCENAR